MNKISQIYFRCNIFVIYQGQNVILLITSVLRFEETI